MWSSALLFCLVVALVDAHTYLSSVTINGVKETQCLRPLGTNNPISSVLSQDMMCGFLPQGARPAQRSCPVTAGSVVGLQWNHNGPTPNDDIIADSHKGPCLAYLSSDNGKTWFKIFENGYDMNKKTFCVTTLIANKGLMQVTIPNDIAPGNYLLRGEILALHEAYRENGVQPYVDCAEITITNSKGNVKPSTVTFPGAYSPKDPGILINIYDPITTPYIIPGPKVYVPGGKVAEEEQVEAIEAVESGNQSPREIISPGIAAGISILVVIAVVVAGVAVGRVYLRRLGQAEEERTVLVETK
jgi:cellulase